MSIITVRVCEECGRNYAENDASLVVAGMDVKSAVSDRTILHSNTDLDFCSPGCMLRYVSKRVEKVVAEMSTERHAMARAGLDDQIRVA